MRQYSSVNTVIIQNCSSHHVMGKWAYTQIKTVKIMASSHMNTGIHFLKQHKYKFTSSNVIHVIPISLLSWPENFQSITC